jgi:hypothetical protein
LFKFCKSCSLTLAELSANFSAANTPGYQVRYIGLHSNLSGLAQILCHGILAIFKSSAAASIGFAAE